jgi:hypothetical protein
MIDAFDRVGNWQCRYGGAGCPSGLNRARDESSAGKRPGRIMDQHGVRRVRAQCFEAGENRSLPRRAAVNGRQDFKAVCRLAIEIAVVGMDHGLHQAACGLVGKQRQSPPQHGFAGDRPELLGHACNASAATAPGSYDNRRNFLPRYQTMPHGLALACSGSCGNDQLCVQRF